MPKEDFCVGKYLRISSYILQKKWLTLSCEEEILHIDFFTMKAPQQLRKEERISAEIPVKVSGQAGISRDISASGILFEIDNLNDVSTEISFELELNTPNGKMTVKCSGDIVRKETKGRKSVIAVKIVDSEFT